MAETTKFFSWNVMYSAILMIIIVIAIPKFFPAEYIASVWSFVIIFFILAFVASLFFFQGWPELQLQKPVTKKEIAINAFFLVFSFYKLFAFPIKSEDPSMQQWMLPAIMLFWGCFAGLLASFDTIKQARKLTMNFQTIIWVISTMFALSFIVPGSQQYLAEPGFVIQGIFVLSLPMLIISEIKILRAEQKNQSQE